MKHVAFECFPFSDMDLPVVFSCKNITSFSQEAQEREDLELLYVLSGHLMSSVNTLPAKRVTPGNLVVLNHFDTHQLYSSDNSTMLCSLIIGNQFLRNCGFVPQDIYIEHYVQGTRITETFQMLLRENQGTQQHYLIEMKSLIASLIVYLSRNHAMPDVLPVKKAQRKKVQMVNRVLEYLQDHYTSNITNQQLAENLSFDLYYLSHIFKELTGRTIRTHINRLRCIHAHKLILLDQYTINEVMQMVGFNNASYFSRTYKSHIGCKPSETIALSNADYDLGARSDPRIPKIKAWTWTE